LNTQSLEADCRSKCRISLAEAVSFLLQQIPEGVAVALPVYFATGSRLRGLSYAVISGLAEPAAVVVLAMAGAGSGWLSKSVIDCLLAAVREGCPGTYSGRSYANVLSNPHGCWRYCSV
jgi:zinc transporter ZupT